MFEIGAECEPFAEVALKLRIPPYWNQIDFYETIRFHVSGRKWLDLGCGRGTSDPALIPIRRGMHEFLYVGTDLDEASLKDCRETNRVLADACSLPFADGSFELVSSNMVFEHLDDPLSVLREVRRVLTNGGNLIIHTPSSWHFILLVGRLLSAILPNGLYRRLVSVYTGRKEQDIFPTRYLANTEKALKGLAAESGFQLVQIRYLETPYTLPAHLPGFEKAVRRFLPDRFKSSMLILLTR